MKYKHATKIVMFNIVNIKLYILCRCSIVSILIGYDRMVGINNFIKMHKKNSNNNENDYRTDAVKLMWYSFLDVTGALKKYHKFK